MFYYPAALRRHTGCFSTIWLAATKGIRVTRRDFLKVNVTKTCDDIMDYVLERVEAPRSDLPRPRFSLYLSSQLQYGVILVYHRQCIILLEEIQNAVDWLLKQKIPQKNNMDDSSRPAPLLGDMLSLMEETEGAPDPLFGQMYMQETLPSPRSLLQGHLRDKSPPHLQQERAPAAPSPPAKEAAITASPEEITLREPEPVPFLVPEYEGVELEDHPDTVDLLLAEQDQFPEGGILRDIDLEREQERREEVQRRRSPDQTMAELQPTTLSSEDAVLLPQDDPHLPQDDPHLSPGPAAPPVDQVTPVSAPVLPSPPSADRKDVTKQEESSPEELQPKRKRRRRQLIFIDPETQLSQEELQEQIDDPSVQTATPSLLSRPPAPSAVDLLNNPTTLLLAEDLLRLWKQAAVITPVSGPDLQVGDRGPDSTDSEKDREGASTEVRRGLREAPEAEQLNGSGSAMSSLILENSEQMEGSRFVSPMPSTPDREGSIVSRSVSIPQDIPEETEFGPGRDSLGTLPELVECEEGPVSFQSLLPPGCSRRTVSHHFQRLLGALSSRKLRAEQREPYGDILLSVRSPSLVSISF